MADFECYRLYRTGFICSRLLQKKTATYLAICKKETTMGLASGLFFSEKISKVNYHKTIEIYFSPPKQDSCYTCFLNWFMIIGAEPVSGTDTFCFDEWHLANRLRIFLSRKTLFWTKMFFGEIHKIIFVYLPLSGALKFWFRGNHKKAQKIVKNHKKNTKLP